MTNRRSYLSLLSLGVCALALSACQTTGSTSNSEEARSEKINAALERATAAVEGSNQSIGTLERNYKRNSADPLAAAAYARALREDEQLSQAEAILAPFANDPKSPAKTKTEYAGLQLAQGNYESAENYAKKAVMQDDHDPEAFHYLGIALDTQGKHPEAERAFRKALDYWQGDPTTVMNNLALNLAAQEYLDEAVEILYKAKALSPDRVEVERNLRIVLALQQSSGQRQAPKPKAKPDAQSH
jgi:Flp pilus assembly protein TadD